MTEVRRDIRFRIEIDKPEILHAERDPLKTTADGWYHSMDVPTYNMMIHIVQSFKTLGVKSRVFKEDITETTVVTHSSLYHVEDV
jgi:hypothetical protein